MFLDKEQLLNRHMQWEKFRNKHYFLDDRQKKMIIDKAAEFLNNFREILFAIVYGSFMDEQAFKDIDLAIYIDHNQVQKSLLKYEIELEIVLEKIVGFPVDVRLLNLAPVPFRYNVLKNGKLILPRDEDVYADFMSHTLVSYFDFAPYRRHYLKEVLGIEI